MEVGNIRNPLLPLMCAIPIKYKKELTKGTHGKASRNFFSGSINKDGEIREKDVRHLPLPSDKLFITNNCPGSRGSFSPLFRHLPQLQVYLYIRHKQHKHRIKVEKEKKFGNVLQLNSIHYVHTF